MKVTVKKWRIYTNISEGGDSTHFVKAFEDFKQAWQFADHWHKLGNYDPAEEITIYLYKDKKRVRAFSLNELTAKYGHWN